MQYTPHFPWAIYDGSRSASQCAPCQPDFFGLVILVLVCPSPMVISTAPRRRASKVSRLHARHGKDWFFALTVDAKSFRFAEVFLLLAPNASVGSTVHPVFHWYTTHLSLFCCLAMFLFFPVLFVLSVCFVRELRVCFSTWPNVF